MSQISFATDQGYELALQASRPRFPTQNGRVTSPVGVLSQSGPFVVNSVLPYDSWREMDSAVQMVSQPLLAVTGTLRGMPGMVDTVNSYGTLVSRYTKASGVTGAKIDMTGRTTPPLDRVEREFGGAPIPVFHQGFELGARELAAASQGGESVDTTEAEAAANAVATLIETSIVDGTSVKYDGYTLYGLRNHPNRVTAAASTLTGGTGYWTDSDEVLPTIAGMYTALAAKYRYGPYILFLATQEYNILATSFATATDVTMLQRVSNLGFIQSVVHAPKMTAGDAVMLEASRQTLVLKEHSWIGLNEFVAPVTGTHNFLVKAVLGWMFKPDYDGNLGLYHVTGLHA